MKHLICLSVAVATFWVAASVPAANPAPAVISSPVPKPRLAARPTSADLTQQLDSSPYVIGIQSVLRAQLSSMPGGRLVFPEIGATSDQVRPVPVTDFFTHAEGRLALIVGTRGDCDKLRKKYVGQCWQRQRTLGISGQSPVDPTSELEALNQVLGNVITAAATIPVPAELSRARGAQASLVVVPDGNVSADCYSGVITIPEAALHEVIATAGAEAQQRVESDDVFGDEDFPSLSPPQINYLLKNVPDYGVPNFGTVDFSLEMERLPDVHVPKRLAATVRLIRGDGNRRRAELIASHGRIKPIPVVSQNDNDNDQDSAGVKAFLELTEDQAPALLNFLADSGSKRAAELRELVPIARAFYQLDKGDLDTGDDTDEELLGDYLTGAFFSGIKTTLSAYRTLVFVLAHEFYHVKYDRCAPLLTNETSADMFAVAVYQSIFETLELPDSFGAQFGDDHPAGHDTGHQGARGPNRAQALMMQSTASYLAKIPKSQTVAAAAAKLERTAAARSSNVRSMFGVSAMQTLLLMYSTNAFFEGDVSHAPIEVRMQAAMRAYYAGVDQFSAQLWGELSKSLRRAGFDP